MPTIHLRLAARAAAAWCDAVTLEKDVALRKAAEIIARECAARQLDVPPGLAHAEDLSRAALNSAVERAPGRYREAVRTLAGCLLAEETQSSASIDLTFSILNPPTTAMRLPGKRA